MVANSWVISVKYVNESKHKQKQTLSYSKISFVLRSNSICIIPVATERNVVKVMFSYRDLAEKRGYMWDLDESQFAIFNSLSALVSCWGQNSHLAAVWMLTYSNNNFIHVKTFIAPWQAGWALFLYVNSDCVSVLHGGIYYTYTNTLEYEISQLLLSCLNVCIIQWQWLLKVSGWIYCMSSRNAFEYFSVFPLLIGIVIH